MGTLSNNLEQDEGISPAVSLCFRGYARRWAVFRTGGAGKGVIVNTTAGALRKGTKREGLIWANLVHLSFNMWGDGAWPSEEGNAQPFLRFDDRLWNDILVRMADAGMNMVVVDAGDGIRYESHPEIPARNAWSKKKTREQLKKAREMGLEPVPKLNFSACHDTWLGTYQRCVSTDTYYGVCRDLIAEVADLFDKPRLFHLGMDEETAHHQRYQRYVVIRQHDLWWHDLYFLVEQVEKAGCRAWIWADYVWTHPDEFFQKMPRSVLQSNWYYGNSFARKLRTRNPFGPYNRAVIAYELLEKHGYDQVPTGSNWNNPVNFLRTVRHCRKTIAPRRLKGFLQTSWRITLEHRREPHMQAIGQVAEAILKYRKAEEGRR